MSMNNALGRTLLTLAHVSWVFVLVYTARRKLWVMFTLSLLAAVMSIMMHLCQISPQYGLTTDNFCWYGSGIDVQIGTSLGDYITAYTALVQWAVYGPDVHWIMQACMTLIYYSFNVVIVSESVPSITAPALLNGLLVLISLFTRVLVLYRKNELERFFDQHVSYVNFFTGLFIMAFAVVFYYLQTDDNYIWTHCMWMLLVPIGFYFLVRTYDPKSSFLQDVYFCCQCCCPPEKKEPPVLMTLERLTHDHQLMHVVNVPQPTYFQWPAQASGIRRKEKVYMVDDSIIGVHF